MGSSTRNPVFLWLLPRNPGNTKRVPGGSSGGSAACGGRRACARQATGTDTGWLDRQPAGFTALTGISKPTYGRVRRWGMIAYAIQSRIRAARWHAPPKRTAVDATSDGPD